MRYAFKPIELDKEAEYSRLFGQCPQPSSDYTFANLWGWAEEYNLSWAWDDGLVWIRQETPQPCYWAPVGNWATIDWQEKLSFFPREARFTRVPEQLAGLWESLLAGRVKVEEARDHWDYLYSSRDLIELRGNRFHKKKNLVRQFHTKYDYHYLPMKKSLVAKTLAMQEDWCAWKNCEASAGLSAENRVIERILLEWDRLAELQGGLLVVNDEVAAFTVGELIGADNMVIHFEKGLGVYKGIYQTINKLFLEANSYVKTVNREQDLGNSGLRKAKLSYHPIGFIRKFNIHFF